MRKVSVAAQTGRCAGEQRVRAAVVHGVEIAGESMHGTVKNVRHIVARRSVLSQHDASASESRERDTREEQVRVPAANRTDPANRHNQWLWGRFERGNGPPRH